MPNLRLKRSEVRSQKSEGLNSKSVAVLKSKYLQKGFTLIEILVTITIIGIMAAVSIPNLKKYGQDQDLLNSTNDLKNLIRKAQSNAQAGVICSNNILSSSWNVSLIQSPPSIQLNCIYKNASGTLITYPETPFITPAQLSFSCSPDLLYPLTGDIVFGSSSVNSYSISIAGCPHSVAIKLNQNNSSKYVYVTNGGSIYESKQ